jgi:hypothetical protein
VHLGGTGDYYFAKMECQGILMSTDQPRRLRIFLSSPSDVSEERELARELVDSVLRKDPAFRDHLIIESVAWDDPEAPTPMLATETPQISVNAAKPRPSQCDIVVVTLWSRIGSPFEFEGRQWASGTEWEYEDAAGASSRPDILVYRRTESPPLHDLDLGDEKVAEKLAEKQAQFQALRNFLGRIRAYTGYSDPSDFRRRLEQDLRTRLARHLPASGYGAAPDIAFASDTLSRFGVDLSAPPAFRAGAEQFIASYIGTREKPVPFGGRKAILEHLDGWLGDPAASRRLLLYAPAGRGKSALVVRWLALVADRCHLIFLPISVRFGTNRAELFYHALAARLAGLLGVEFRPPDADPVGYYQGIAIDLLRRVGELDRTVLLLIDGLDEGAGWQIDPALLPHEPDRKLRIVVSARLQAGDRAEEGWLGRLRWDRLGGAPAVLRIAPLDIAGICDVLRHMGDALAGLAGNPEIAEQLARLTDGDPLLVRLYAEDLRLRGAGAGRIRPEELTKLTPGFGPFFRDWLADQEALWQAPGSAVDRETVDLLLLLLACALGPLTHADLADLYRHLRGRDFHLPRRAVAAVERFVLGDGAEVGYVLAHPKLADHLRHGYFADPATVEAAHRAFVSWGGDILGQLNIGKLRPGKCPRYLLLYHRQHLEIAGAESHALMAMVEDGWRQAWEGLEGGPRGFAGDVAVAWQRVRHLDDGTAAGLGRSLAGQLRCALMMSSLRSIGTNMPAELIVTATREGLLSTRQALYFATLARPVTLCATLAGILDMVPAPERAAVLAEALVAAKALRHPDQHAEAVAYLLPHLPEPKRAAVLEEALAVVQAAPPDFSGPALARLLPHLPDPERAAMLDEAVAVARALRDAGDEYRCAYNLAHLGPHLPEPRRTAVLAEALATAQTLHDQYERSAVLQALAPHLRGPSVAAAFAAMAGINAFSRRRALYCFAPHFPEPQRTAFLTEAVETARKDLSGFDGGEALARLAPHLSEPERAAALEEALATVEIPHSYTNRRGTLAALAPQLGRPALARALAAALEIRDARARAIFLAALVPYLAGAGRTAALAASRATLKDGVPGEVQTEVFLNLLPYVTDSERSRLLTEAVTAARAAFWTVRAERIASVGLLHPEPSRTNLLSEALAAAKATSWVRGRAATLALLAADLPASECTTLLADTLAVARETREHTDRRLALIALTPHLPDTQRTDVIREAVAAAQANGNAYGLSDAICAVAPHTQGGLAEEMLAIAHTIEYPGPRSVALAAVALRLPRSQRESVLADALTIARADARAGGYQCAKALAQISKCLLEPECTAVLAEALTACEEYESEFDKVQALTEFGASLDGVLAERALRALLEIADRVRRLDLLDALREFLPAIFTLGGADAVESLRRAVADTATWYP